MSEFNFRRVPALPVWLAALLLWIIGFCSARAIEIGFTRVDSHGDTVETEIAVIDSLSSKILEYIERGVPISFEYRTELWKVRAGWFDRQAASHDISYKIRYDTWARQYVVLEMTSQLVVENTLPLRREALAMVLASGPIELPADDSLGVYYLVGRFSAKVMTLSNFRDVESWLRGEISEVDKPNIRDASNKFGEFLFNTALKVTGLENISEGVKTRNFRLDELPAEIDTIAR